MKTTFKATFRGIGATGEPVFETANGERVHLPVNEDGALEALDFKSGDYVITAEVLPIEVWRASR